MPKYLVKETSYINGAIVEPGQYVDYTPPDGTTVSGNLELVDPKKSAKSADKTEGSGEA